jgi:hypothetical protein
MGIFSTASRKIASQAEVESTLPVYATVPPAPAARSLHDTHIRVGTVAEACGPSPLLQHREREKEIS